MTSPCPSAGLVTAAAVFLPLLAGGLTAVSIAEAVIHRVIGVAVGSLVAGAAASARYEG